MYCSVVIITISYLYNIISIILVIILLFILIIHYVLVSLHVLTIPLILFRYKI